MKIINQMRHQNAAQNTEAPELHHGEMKRSIKGFYMFVSQKNKLIGNAFPDGDVLHIKDIFPDGDVLHIEDVFPDGDVLHIKKCTGGTAHGSI